MRYKKTKSHCSPRWILGRLQVPPFQGAIITVTQVESDLQSFRGSERHCRATSEDRLDHPVPPWVVTHRFERVSSKSMNSCKFWCLSWRRTCTYRGFKKWRFGPVFLYSPEISPTPFHRVRILGSRNPPI